MKRQNLRDNLIGNSANHGGGGCDPEKPGCLTCLAKGVVKLAGCFRRLLIARIEIAIWEILLGVTIGQFVFLLFLKDLSF